MENKMPVKLFRELGYLQELNRLVTKERQESSGVVNEKVDK